MEECFGINGLLTRVEIRQNCGIDFSVRGYANFGRAVTHFVNRLSINRINDGSTVSLRDTLNIKKPGPKIRALMVKRRKKPFDLENQRTVKTFFRINGIQYVGNELFSKVVAVWTEQGFTNRHKSFLFKFFNNILGINTRTSHFAENGTRVCFFVRKKIRRNAMTKVLFIFFICAPRSERGNNNLFYDVFLKWGTWTLRLRKNFG
jgi:hypothetical protein